MTPRDPFDDSDEARGAPEITARPDGREAGERLDEAGAKVVPSTNVGGAAPTPLGLDSGGVARSSEELENLAEPEPPEDAELEALHRRPRREDPQDPRGRS